MIAGRNQTGEHTKTKRRSGVSKRDTEKNGILLASTAIRLMSVPFLNASVGGLSAASAPGGAGAADAVCAKRLAWRVETTCAKQFGIHTRRGDVRHDV